MIWKNKPFWREPTDNNKIYMHPILAIISIVVVLALDIFILIPIIMRILGSA